MAPVVIRRALFMLTAVLAMTLASCGGGGGGGGLSPAPEGTGSWRTARSLGITRQEVCGAAIDETLYVLGGFGLDLDGSGQGIVFDEVEAYSMATETAKRVAPLPRPLHHAACTTLDGRLYVLGGLDGLLFEGVPDAFVYDPATDAWSAIAALPRPRGAGAATVLDGRIFVAGGFRDGASVDDLAVYDPALDSWETLPGTPTARDHSQLVTLGGELLYLAGRENGGIGANVDSVDVYDPAARTWRFGIPMSRSRSGFGAVVWNERIYVFGGEAPDGAIAEVEEYDPGRGTWRFLEPMPTPRHGLGAALFDEQVFVASGAPRPGIGLSELVEVFSFASLGSDPAG